MEFRVVQLMIFAAGSGLSWLDALRLAALGQANWIIPAAFAAWMAWCVHLMGRIIERGRRR